jgi:hypothetical protein
MDSGTRTLHAATVLGAARDFRRAANAAEARVLAAAVEWAHLHVVSEVEDAATWSVAEGHDTGIPIAGDGCPLVSEFAIGELATALGLSDVSGRHLIAQALELAHRLPKLWSRVQAGQLAPWRARRIAEETQDLSVEAAGWVDAQLAPFAHRTGLVQTQRTVEEAIARFMPEYATERRDRAADQRYLTIDHHQVSFTGTSRVHGELDLADALDLEDAITTEAQHLADLGSQESLDARRAAALGAIARRDLHLDLTSGGGEGAGVVSTGSTTGPVPEPVEGSTGSTTGDPEPVRTETGRVARRPRGRHRDVVLYVHLSEDALRSHDPAAPVRVENAGGLLLTAGQVAEWCARTDTDRIIVKPVVDLTGHHHPDDHRVSTGSTTRYRVPAAIAEEVELRDRACESPRVSWRLGYLDPASVRTGVSM